jgi:hypothetical protein
LVGVDKPVHLAIVEVEVSERRQDVDSGTGCGQVNGGCSGKVQNSIGSQRFDRRRVELLALFVSSAVPVVHSFKAR